MVYPLHNFHPFFIFILHQKSENCAMIVQDKFNILFYVDYKIIIKHLTLRKTEWLQYNIFHSKYNVLMSVQVVAKYTAVCYCTKGNYLSIHPYISFQDQEKLFLQFARYMMCIAFVSRFYHFISKSSLLYVQIQSTPFILMSVYIVQ